jgi:hypothetical protein
MNQLETIWTSTSIIVHTTMIGRSVLTSIDKVTDNHHYSHMNTSVVSTLHIKVHPTTVDGSVWPQAPPARAHLKRAQAVG